MRYLPNIEKSAFDRSAYIGYSGSGQLWKIRKMGRYWVARLHQLNGKPLPSSVYHIAPRLSDFSPYLETI